MRLYKYTGSAWPGPVPIPGIMVSVCSSFIKTGQTLTEEEVIAFCREKLASYKVPKVVEFMDDLPESVIGKVLRRELREMEMKRRAQQGEKQAAA